MPRYTLRVSGGAMLTSIKRAQPINAKYVMLQSREFFEAVEQVLTLVVKLQVGSEQQQLLSDTGSAFASACNWINENVNPRLTNRNSIQAVCYQDVKERFGLTANHVVSCGRVAANRLTAKLQGEES